MAIIYPWLQSQWSQVMVLQQQQHLPHAMLLTGSHGLGKTEFAHALGQALLCRSPLSDDVAGQACGKCHQCSMVAAGTHPDFYIIKPAPPKNSKSKHPILTIRIESIRDLCSKLSQTSQMSGYRIAIIEQADKMNAAAANALLKTLEEPGDNTLLILLSTDTSRLPATIRSRCQQFKFVSPSFPQVENWLQLNGDFSDTASCQQAFQLSHHAPLTTLEVAGQWPQRELLASALLAESRHEDILDYALKLSQADRHSLLGWMLDWVNDLARLSMVPDSREQVINQASIQPLTQLARLVDRPGLFRLQTQLLQTLQQGSIALNPQLLWENLLLSWKHLFKPQTRSTSRP